MFDDHAFPEHCITITAQKLEGLIKQRNANADVRTNEHKPRKGAFVVMVGSETVASKLDMKRPFNPLRELDLEALADDVAQRLQKHQDAYVTEQAHDVSRGESPAEPQKSHGAQKRAAADEDLSTSRTDSFHENYQRRKLRRRH